MNTGARTASPSDSNGTGGVLDKLDSFVVAAKQLETALNHERESTRKLRHDLEEQRLRYERQHREDDHSVRELSAKESKLQAALQSFQENERRLVARAHAVTAEVKKVKDELGQYRSAWSDVLQREREAKMILQESEENRRKMTDLEITLKNLHSALEEEKKIRTQAERHSNTYQLELKNALIRLHSAEVKFNELNKELMAHRTVKRNLDEEVATIEADLRERLTLEALKDREKTKAELEREMALDRERYREQVREQIRIELSRAHELDRDQFARIRDGLENEICSLRLTIEQVREESETLRVEHANRVRSIQNTAREELEAVRTDLNQRLVSAHDHAKADNEQIRRDLNAKLLELQVRAGELEAELRASESTVSVLRKDEATVKVLSARLETLESENAANRQLATDATKAHRQLASETEDLRNRTHHLQNERAKLQERAQSLEMALLGLREDVEQNLEKLSTDAMRAMAETPFRMELARVEDQIRVLSLKLQGQVDMMKPRSRGRILARLEELFDEKARLEARQAETQTHLRAQTNSIRQASQNRSVFTAPPARDTGPELGNC